MRQRGRERNSRERNSKEKRNPLALTGARDTEHPPLSPLEGRGNPPCGYSESSIISTRLFLDFPSFVLFVEMGNSEPYPETVKCALSKPPFASR